MQIDELQTAEGGIFDTNFWPRFYDAAAVMFGEDPFPFLNLGYLGPDCQPGVEVDLEAPDLAERLSASLYERALTGLDLARRTVAEVGCGRGGGCSLLADRNRTAEFVGLDRSSELVGWCESNYELPNLRFARGEAEHLPLPSGGFDVVVNVESSHCYDSRAAFFAEVERVLRPGGSFAIADILFLDRAGNAPSEVEAALRGVGLEIAAATEITSEVLAARRAVSHCAAFNARLDSLLPRREAADLFRTLLCMEDSPGYENLQNGTYRYWCWTARKPR
jgi:SAM-dependent methyltransferase